MNSRFYEQLFDIKLDVKNNFKKSSIAQLIAYFTVFFQIALKYTFHKKTYDN